MDGFKGFDGLIASDECKAGVRSCLPNLSTFDATVACRFQRQLALRRDKLRT